MNKEKLEQIINECTNQVRNNMKEKKIDLKDFEGTDFFTAEEIAEPNNTEQVPNNALNPPQTDSEPFGDDVEDYAPQTSQEPSEGLETKKKAVVMKVLKTMATLFGKMCQKTLTMLCKSIKDSMKN